MKKNALKRKKLAFEGKFFKNVVRVGIPQKSGEKDRPVPGEGAVIVRERKTFRRR